MTAIRQVIRPRTAIVRAAMSEDAYLAAWQAQIAASPPEPCEKPFQGTVRDVYPGKVRIKKSLDAPFVRRRRVCEQCGKGFDLKPQMVHATTSYCSAACRKVAQAVPPKICPACGSQFVDRSLYGAKVYCSKLCEDGAPPAVGSLTGPRKKPLRKKRYFETHNPNIKPPVPSDLSNELRTYAAHQTRGAWCRDKRELLRLVQTYGEKNTAHAYGVSRSAVAACVQRLRRTHD